MRIPKLLTLASVVGMAMWLAIAPAHLKAQGYSGALPNVLTPASGLVVTYTAGSVTSGGAVTAITGSTLTVSDTKTSCAAPAYSSCNIIYWTSGASLSTTTSFATAFAPGNVIVAYVTSTGGNVTLVTPSSWTPGAANIIGSNANTGASYFVPAAACNSSVSGNSTGTNGYTVLGTAPSIPVVQAATSASGTNTHYFTCNISPPSAIGVSGRGANISSVDFFYGVQTTGLGTQATVAASGTLNAKTVFTMITYPTAGAGQTATGLVEAARADSGTLVYSNLTNVATTTAGEFYTVTFTPASAIAATSALTQYFLTVSLLNTATSATITNSPGALVHYTY